MLRVLRHAGPSLASSGGLLWGPPLGASSGVLLGGVFLGLLALARKSKENMKKSEKSEKV